MKMKKKLGNLVLGALLVIGLISVVPTRVNAAVTEDTAIEIKGDSQVIDINKTQNNVDKVLVKFTVETTHPDIKGLFSAKYYVKYDADKMDYVAGSLKHNGPEIGIANEDYSKFDVNGTPATKGTLLFGASCLTSKPKSEITLEFTNLFKDGKREPLEIEIINDNLDGFRLEKNDKSIYLPKTPIIENAKISLTALGLTVAGNNSVEKGKDSTYTAAITNALDASKGVTWEVTGGVKTTIDSHGKLSVGLDETASKVTVKATSVEDTSVVVTKDVTLTTPPEISVSIAGPSEVIKGTKTDFKANVFNTTNQAVTWEVTGQSSPKTVIGADGKLTVGMDETATELMLKATSVQNTAKTSTLKVALKEKTYTIVDVKLPIDKIEMENGTTEKEFDVEAQKNKLAKVTMKTNDGKTLTIDVAVLSYKSDKDVVGTDGVIMEGRFNLIYTLDLPFVEMDEEGTVTTSAKETNVIGKETVSIPSAIGVKVTDEPIIDVEPDKDQGTKPNEKKEPINEVVKEAIKTSDENNLIIYTIGLVGCGALLSGLMMKRKKEKNRG